MLPAAQNVVNGWGKSVSSEDGELQSVGRLFKRIQCYLLGFGWYFEKGDSVR